jgi:hypothetical protein
LVALVPLQLAPDESQRIHAYAYFRFLPCHVPRRAVSLFPTSGMPLIEGGATLIGMAPHIGGRVFASAAMSMAQRTTKQTDSAPRRIRSAVF